MTIRSFTHGRSMIQNRSIAFGLALSLLGPGVALAVDPQDDDTPAPEAV